MATLYHIFTKERAYNFIESPTHFKKVRRVWGDESPIVSIHKFLKRKEKGSHWKRVDKKKFERLS
ncbi:MAG: hypothetical protein AM326_08300 [Candidatus Thorarchaeota archaeon SMTZ-45]|nr:MAG: hypothetical protein AM326_08300 [Candidatus Thorarchaeota archaeon SMTZ-45]